jgi:hypothetical protein
MSQNFKCGLSPIEHDDLCVVLGVVVRYLDAVTPRITLLKLLSGDDTSLMTLNKRLRG